MPGVTKHNVVQTPTNLRLAISFYYTKKLLSSQDVSNFSLMLVAIGLSDVTTNKYSPSFLVTETEAAATSMSAHLSKI